jgi:hypothetical protein
MYRIVLVLYLFCMHSVKSTEILYLIFCKIYTNILYLFCILTRNFVHILYISSQYSVPILFKTHYDFVSFCTCSVRILYSIFCADDSVLKWPLCTYSVVWSFLFCTILYKQVLCMFCIILYWFCTLSLIIRYVFCSYYLFCTYILC